MTAIRWHLSLRLRARLSDSRESFVGAALVCGFLVSLSSCEKFNSKQSKAAKKASDSDERRVKESSDSGDTEQSKPTSSEATAMESGGAGSTPGPSDVKMTEGGFWTDLDDRAAEPHASPAPENVGPPTRSGTLTFTNIGAPGHWGRRIEAEPGDERCDMQSETINYSWGGSEFCCRTRHEVTSDRLTPFNEQLELILEGPLRVKQLAVYQPFSDTDGPWGLRSYWDHEVPDNSFNLQFVGPNDVTHFDGVLGNNCSLHAMQQRPFSCGSGSDPYCPGSNLDYDGWSGSKLFVLLASMPYADDPSMQPLSCIDENEDEREQDAPWIGLGPSELTRDGWSGYHPCHCFSNTDGALGDGCGQINVFEVIGEASGARWGNRDVISTGIRSYQVGSLGGATCGIEGCGIEQFPDDAELLDANNLKAMKHGAVIDADNRASAEGPVWRRALDDRYYVFLLDEETRTVQVAILHPSDLPAALDTLLPTLPNELPRTHINSLIELRLPQAAD